MVTGDHMLELLRLEKTVLAAIVFIVALASATERPAGGQDLMRIAAVVNEEVISIYDLAARIDIVVTSSNLEDSPELRRQVAPQVLRSLVDEHIQMQEAKRLDITVDEVEIDDAVKRIEERNGLPPGGFDQFVRTRRLDRNAIVEQIRAEILWSKVVRRRLGASISVGEDEIDEALSRLESNRGRPEYRIAEIFIGVERADEDTAARNTARRLAEQLAGGAQFPEIARQFSQSATAAVGGDIGWVVEGQLPTELDAVLPTMEPGQISAPIRAFDGYYIIALLDRRTVLTADPLETKLHLAQLIVPAAPAGGPNPGETVERIRSEVQGCEALLAAAGELGSDLSGDLGEIAVKDLPTEIRAVVADLPAGRAAAPIPFNGGLRVLMVCARDAAQSALPDRDTVRRDIAGRRLENLARRYLRDLRRAAFIDYRI